jgi:hypothetical protein
LPLKIDKSEIERYVGVYKMLFFSFKQIKSSSGLEKSIKILIGANFKYQ